MTEALSLVLSRWAAALELDQVPADVLANSRLRILDTLGLALQGRTCDAGKAILLAEQDFGGSGAAHVFGSRHATGAAAAALVNGALAESIDYDDTHNESIVHPSSPVVSGAFAMGEQRRCSGAELLLAVAIGNELTCRLATIAPGAFHPHGFHPTGLMGTFGAAYAVSRLCGLDAEKTASAVGIAGSFAAGILECWVDGSWVKTIHPGWAAHGGIIATHLAKSGFTGPDRVFEGKWGFFNTHLRDAGASPDFERAVRDLGSHWESRNISFKPYPNAHIAHGIFDAVLALRKEYGIAPEQVKSVTCHVPPHMVAMLCEPLAEKLSPASAAQARVSLQFSVAEALAFGRLDAESYSDRRLADPLLLQLASKVGYRVDPDPPPRSQYQGWVVVEMLDGRRLEKIQRFNRGSPQNPMTQEEVEEKFRVNTRSLLAEGQATEVIQAVSRIEDCRDLGALAGLMAIDAN